MMRRWTRKLIVATAPCRLFIAAVLTATQAFGQKYVAPPRQMDGPLLRA